MPEQDPDMPLTDLDRIAREMRMYALHHPIDMSAGTILTHGPAPQFIRDVMWKGQNLRLICTYGTMPHPLAKGLYLLSASVSVGRRAETRPTASLIQEVKNAFYPIPGERIIESRGVIAHGVNSPVSKRLPGEPPYDGAWNALL